jgi:hypothetical protein
MNASVWPNAPAQQGSNWNSRSAPTQENKPAASKPPTPKKYARIPLRTIGEVQSEAGRIYRLARSGQMDSAECSRLASVLALIARMIEGGELEKRIAALEERGY